MTLVSTIGSSFAESLDAAAQELAALRRPARNLEEQLASSATMMRWLHDGGWTRLGWPEEVGGSGGSPTLRGQVYDDLAGRGYAIPDHMFVLEVVGPAVVRHAPALAAEVLPAALRGDELWSQGFSEPEAGSDLASLRTRAVETDDGFTISGQKIWTSYGARADKIVLLARTGTTASRHRGLTMLLVDLDQEGIDRRPIALASGREELSEIFFTDVHVGRDRLIGAVNGGWAVAMDLLQYERGMYAWMRMASTTQRLREILDEASPEVDDPIAHEAVGRAYLALAALRARTAVTLRRLAVGEVVGPETSIDKVLLATAEQTVLDTARELMGTEFMLGDGLRDTHWREEWWYSRAASIYGGAAEVQRTIIADRLLGLPKETTSGR
ncbi:Butyryl-CoA dehydrogenase [Rhodococcus wratislaviensis]|uniref:Butyryl-CoA dehydrogenase n=1 Tax=Rhodococcus wratislaviensis TaxID=44752 RepID=A0A402CG15_RHOWR|nr:Butyryl-CoA dehydrogenase [Rhodococcus wratislaviensis]